MISNEKECLFCPVSERIGQVGVYTGTFAIFSDLDVLVKLLEECEGYLSDFKLAK